MVWLVGRYMWCYACGYPCTQAQSPTLESLPAELIAAPKPRENRVVFPGDSLTRQWSQGKKLFFPGKPYFNRGIAARTTT